VQWIFRIQDTADAIRYYSTGTVSTGNEWIDNGHVQEPGWYNDNEWEYPHSFKIVNFSGITMRRGKSEAGIHAPNDVSFTISNASNTLTASSFVGGTVRIGLVIGDTIGKELINSWRFRIKSASPYGQQIDIVCEDFTQEFLKGTYPNTRLVSDIFPNVLGTVSDNVCVPEPYGTCYIPLRSVYAVDGRYYLLGETTNTYTITAVRSPRECGAKLEWASTGFTFTQATKADAASHNWRMFQPIIADSNNDGTVDASGLWMTGSKILDMPTKFTRSDTASMTSPADIIRTVLRNMGAQDYDLNLDSFDSAKSTYSGWGLTWNFAFWYKEDRPKVLARLLTMCHSCLRVGEQISLVVLNKAPQETITDAEVLKMQDVGPDTFRYTDTISERNSDSGYVGFAKSGESQDEFIKVLVPAKTTTATPDGEVVVFPGVSDTQKVQKLGTLYYQRKYLKSADVSFTAKGTVLYLRPDDVVTINYADYGGSYDVLIDEVTINPDCSVSIAALKFSAALDDWGDLSPSAITIITEGAITTVYSPVVAGPDGTGTTYPNLVPGRLRIGSGTNTILLDPAGDGKIEMGYTAPGDNSTTAGAGLKITGGNIEAYGLAHSFGGMLMSSDGNYMACVGKYLTATGLTKRYPINNATNFTSDGRINIYRWSVNSWFGMAAIGYTSSANVTAYITARDTNGVAVLGDAINNPASGGIGVYGTGNLYGVWGTSDSNGYGGVFGQTDMEKAPIVLSPSASANAPTHAAMKGSLWVTSAGVLYINTDASTTWAKVGAQ